MVKKQPYMVLVTLHKEDGPISDDRQHTISIPKGGKFIVNWNFCVDRVLRKDKTIVADYDWQAGYTKAYTYFYED